MATFLIRRTGELPVTPSGAGSAKRGRAARGAAAAKALDPLDRMAIDFEHMLPGSGDPVRLARLLHDPVAFDYAPQTMERLAQAHDTGSD